MDNTDDGGDGVKASALKACEFIVTERTAQRDKCEENLRVELKKAFSMQKDIRKQGGPIDSESHFQQWLRMIFVDAGVGDFDAKARISELLTEVGYDRTSKQETSLQPAGSKRLDAESTKLKDLRFDHRQHAHELKKLEKELVGRVRSLRYFTVIRDLQNKRPEEATSFDCPGCDKTELPISDIAILSSCGHLGCHACMIASAQREECVYASKGCGAAARVLNVVNAESLGTEDEESRHKGKHYGFKLEKIVKLVQQWVACPSDHRCPI